MMPCDPGGTQLLQPTCDKQHVRSVSFHRLSAARHRSRYHNLQLIRFSLYLNRLSQAQLWGTTSKIHNAIRACERDTVRFLGPCVTLHMKMTRYTVSEGDTHTHTHSVPVSRWYFGRCESPSQTLLGQYYDTLQVQTHDEQTTNPSPCPTFAKNCTCPHHAHLTPRFIRDWAAALQESL